MFEKLKEGVAKGLVSVGLAETEETPEATPAATLSSAPPPASRDAMRAAKTDESPDVARAAKYNEQAKAALQEALTGANVKLIPELESLLSNLEAAIPTEAVRYPTALKILASKGTPITAILSEYDLYIGALEEKNRAFSQEIKDQFDQRVGSKVKAVADYDARIAAAQAQIETLQKQILDLARERKDEQSGISEAQGKLDLLGQCFVSQYNTIRTRVEQQKTQIAEYGKGL